MMVDPPHPLLLINFDESSFSHVQERGKTKTAYTHKKSSTKPYWRKETELNFISMVVAIIAGCIYLRFLCLIQRKRLDN